MSIQARVTAARVEFETRPFLKPLVLSTGKITGITEASATVEVDVAGRRARGRGSTYLSELWAWPDPTRSREERERLLRQLCIMIADELSNWLGGEAAHPLELGLRLHHLACDPLFGPSDIPALARAMCLSPFDAAIHDATGIAMARSAFGFYDESAPIPSADALFPSIGASSAIRKLLRSQPLFDLPAWVIIGKDDDLDRDIRPWIVDRGYRCAKLKIMGKDSATDSDRTNEVFESFRCWGVASPRFTLDSNEGHCSAAPVEELLRRLRRDHADAFAALEYLEQPTSRDICGQPYDWQEVAKLTPVLLDEGLTDFDLLSVAAEQHWSGLALKTCKGHSFTLVAAAWAHLGGMMLALQDLTNPGYALIHAALMAAHLPTVNGVELNSPQFTPAANQRWLDRLSMLMEPRDGTHHVPWPIPSGLGSNLEGAKKETRP